MPLILCPNDNATMQQVKRSGVEFDICPTCRGVWLDRGELEKLMNSASDEAAAIAPQQAYQPDRSLPPQQAYQPDRSRQRDYDYDDDDDRRDDRYRSGQPQKRKRGLDIFDIFD